MDFFEHQDAARKRTGLLVALLLAAVVAIIALVYGVVLLVASQGMSQVAQHNAANGGYVTTPGPLPYLELLGGTTLGVLIIVIGGSLYKTSQLSSGGGAVARSLGGRLLDTDTTDADERRLLNVVEEMSIASGMRVPDVYLMDDEEGINAFAAGWSPDTAVVGVTRGCVQQLSRDELQGVIAHEFSHILNGDMRINIRLIGVIFGILAISVVGATMMRILWYSGGSRRRSKDSDAKAAIAIFVIGLSLYIIGYVGVFFGKLIQAAVSRQREFLADASAVQFTRNPDGISGALRRIGGLSTGSKLDTSHAAEHSHMFFGSAVSNFLGSAFATHPPLDQRIKRVLPSWDGSLLPPRDTAPPVESESPKQSSMERAREALPDVLTGGIPGMPEGAMGLAGAVLPGVVAGSAVEQIGQPTTQHLDYAHRLVESIPSVLRTAAHTSAGAQATVYALLLDRDDEQVSQKQLAYLNAQAPGTVSALVHRLSDEAGGLAAGARLPLLDMAMPALNRLPAEEARAMKTHIDALVKADRKLDLFEWALQKVVDGQLGERDQPSAKPRFQKVSQVAAEVAVLLSMLAYTGGGDLEKAAQAMTAASGKLGEQASLIPKADLSFAELSKAIDKLETLAPLAKKKLVTACAACIAADGQVKAREAELMRVVAESLGVPMPPLLPDQALV